MKTAIRDGWGVDVLLQSGVKCSTASFARILSGYLTSDYCTTESICISSGNYCGEFDNAGGIMVVKENLVCSFKVLRPMSHRPMIEETQGRRAHVDTYNGGDDDAGSPGRTPGKPNS